MASLFRRAMKKKALRERDETLTTSGGRDDTWSLPVQVSHSREPVRMRNEGPRPLCKRERIKLRLKGLFKRSRHSQTTRSVQGRPGTPLDFERLLHGPEDQPDRNGLYPLCRVYARSIRALDTLEDNHELLTQAVSPIRTATPPRPHSAAHLQDIINAITEFPDHKIPPLSLGPPRVCL